jgi:hypothetical protein
VQQPNAQQPHAQQAHAQQLKRSRPSSAQRSDAACSRLGPVEGGHSDAGSEDDAWQMHAEAEELGLT